jgi:hypothetical protein
MSIQVRYEIYGSWKTPKEIKAEEVLQSLKDNLAKTEEEQGHKFVGNFENTKVMTSMFRFRIPVIIAYDGNEKAHLRFLLKLCASFLSDLNHLSGTVMAIGDNSFDQLGENHGYNLNLSEIKST